MALVGGFLGGYAVMFAASMFGNAQTVNLINAVRDMFSGDLSALLLRLLGALIYFAALAFTVILPRLVRVNLEYVALGVDGACLLILAVLPKGVNDFFILYPIFFAMAFQWPVFSEIEGFNSSTIFSSNNYRQFTTAILSYALDRKTEQLNKARVYGFTLLYFHIGVALACVSTAFFGRTAALAAFLPLVSALCFKLKGEKQRRRAFLTDSIRPK